jgi:hypothetical protein
MRVDGTAVAEGRWCLGLNPSLRGAAGDEAIQRRSLIWRRIWIASPLRGSQ